MFPHPKNIFHFSTRILSKLTVYRFVARVQSPIDTFGKTVVSGNSAGQDLIYIAMNSIHIQRPRLQVKTFGRVNTTAFDTFSMLLRCMHW